MITEESTVFPPIKTVVFPAIVMVGGAVEDTFIVMPVDVALDGVAHVALLVITTVIVVPFDNPLFE